MGRALAGRVGLTHRAALGGTSTARELFFDVLGSRCCWCLSYFILRRRESVALYTLVLTARGLAWSERLGPCHW